MTVQTELFLRSEIRTASASVSNPSGYKGLASFHKYWGKKPIELLSYLIQEFSNPNDLIVDPFLGSGLVAREATALSRRFLGTDINPFSIELSSLLVDLPESKAYEESFDRIESAVRDLIFESYLRSDGTCASHYLWDDGKILSIWLKESGKRTRTEKEPDGFDLERSNKYSGHNPKQLRKLRFFTNARINATPELSLKDIFKGRALRNIDLIIDAIKQEPLGIKRALLLTLTSSIGQMSNMVFAISKRNKTKGEAKEGMEVGSWVIGYWRPKTHFEVNVWNCFSLRAKRFIKTLRSVDRETLTGGSLNDVISFKADYCLLNKSCIEVMKEAPPESASIVLTDPPHSDRMPYLELSELWNSVLGLESDFEKEIVVSNAKERNMGKRAFSDLMFEFCMESQRILKSGGYLVIMHNARDSLSWDYLNRAIKSFDRIAFIGAIPAKYSAGSVVQDNRKGALKTDYVLIFHKDSKAESALRICSFPGYTTEIPHFA